MHNKLGSVELLRVASHRISHMYSRQLEPDDQRPDLGARGSKGRDPCAELLHGRVLTLQELPGLFRGFAAPSCRSGSKLKMRLSPKQGTLRGQSCQLGRLRQTQRQLGRC